MNDLFSSKIDDDLFDDEPSNGGQGGQQTTTPAGNGGTMDNGSRFFQEKDNPKTGDENGNGNQPKKQERADDNDIMQRLNSMVTPDMPDELRVGDNDDVVSVILKRNGINPSAIEIHDENGQPQIVSFSELTRDEQIDMLNSIGGQKQYTRQDDNDLDDEEIDLLNSIRKSRMNVSDFVSAIKEQAVNEFLENGGGERLYSVDELDDDDLYMSDYAAKVPNATEEEVVAALEAAKANPQVFKRTMEGMRETYKQQEEAKRQADMQNEEMRVAKQQEEYENIIVDAVGKMSKIQFGELDINLSNDDKEQIASAILDRDITGARYLANLINDPDTLSKMVWFALKGEEGIDQMQRYYRKEITERQSAAYRKGFEDAKNGKNMSYTVQRPKGQQRGNGGFHQIGSLEDIDSGID